MKGLRIFLATFALTLTIGVVAQDSVIPSRLRLQALGVQVSPRIAGTITIGSNEPTIFTDEADAAADNQLWRVRGAGSGLFEIGACNDAISTCGAGLTLSRSGGGISNIQFGNSTNNPPASFLGSGTVTVGGVFVASNDIRPSADNLIDIGVGANNFRSAAFDGTVTAGTVSAATGTFTAATVGGSNVCRADGTNCPTVGSQGNLSFGSYSGFSSNPILSGTWTRAGNLVCLSISSLSGGTSNATNFGFTISGMPAISDTIAGTVVVRNNGNWQTGNYRIENTGAVFVAEQSASSNAGFNANFTASGSKDIQRFNTCYRT